MSSHRPLSPTNRSLGSSPPRRQLTLHSIDKVPHKRKICAQTMRSKQPQRKTGDATHRAFRFIKRDAPSVQSMPYPPFARIVESSSPLNSFPRNNHNTEPSGPTRGHSLFFLAPPRGYQSRIESLGGVVYPILLSFPPSFIPLQ